MTPRPAQLVEVAAEKGRGGVTASCAFVVTLIGLAISSYLTYEHYTGSKSFACPATSTVNCEKVTTSAWSVIVGIPVAVLGLTADIAAVPGVDPRPGR